MSVDVNDPEWREWCLKERGRVLTGKHRHWCEEWDGMTMDETCDEFAITCARHVVSSPTPDGGKP